MISFNNLGNLGRLGNQMFQYAALCGISENIKTDYVLPNSSISLYDCFKIPKKYGNSNSKVISEKSYEFDSDLFYNCPDNIDLVGFFQTEKYFSNIKNKIKRDFTFHDDIINICSHYRKSVFLETELISLHIRRTDYLTDKNFHALSLDYYYQALELLPDISVIILSDDYEWCKKYFTSKKFKISKSNNPNIDLCLMSLCDYHIIANSSFSWWGSWLADSKQTIAPRQWFAGEFSSWNTKDLYLTNWIII